MKVLSTSFKASDLNVYIQYPRMGDEIDLFKENGFNVVEMNQLQKADIVVWTGGADINPMLYGERPHVRTYFNPDRDRREIEVYRKSKNKFKIGLCRGGQLLNVLSGGRLWQDVDKHQGSHMMVDHFTNQHIETTSIHHQAFRPGKDAVVVASTLRSTRKEAEHEWWYNGQKEKNPDWATDYEVLFYPSTRSLCVQGHPEMGGTTEFRDYFMELIGRYYNYQRLT